MPSGTISYKVQIRLKGHAPVTKSFKRLTDARKWAQHTETAIQERRYFKTAESEKHTVKEMIERYLTRLEETNPKRIADVKPMLIWWQEHIGHTLLSNFNRALISETIDKLSQKTVERRGETHKITPARVNRYIAAMSHVCSQASREWEWLHENPFAKIKKLKEPRGRVRYLSDEERQGLLKACQNSRYKPLYLIVVLALSTGARKGEILNLCWTDINLERGLIILNETKNGERRVIPLTGHALELVKAHKKVQHIDTDMLFPSATRKGAFEIRKPWVDALREANIEDFRFHDLRHSAASYLAMNGASLAEIAEVLGHKTLSMVKRYAHLSEAHTSSVVASMNERIFGDGVV